MIGTTNLSYNYYIKFFSIKKLENYKFIYNLIDVKIYYPNSIFLKIINKYMNYFTNKKYLKLRPEYIIETEFSKYKMKK